MEPMISMKDVQMSIQNTRVAFNGTKINMPPKRPIEQKKAQLYNNSTEKNIKTNKYSYYGPVPQNQIDMKAIDSKALYHRESKNLNKEKNDQLKVSNKLTINFQKQKFMDGDSGDIVYNL